MSQFSEQMQESFDQYAADVLADGPNEERKEAMLNEATQTISALTDQFAASVVDMSVLIFTEDAGEKITTGEVSFGQAILAIQQAMQDQFLLLADKVVEQVITRLSSAYTEPDPDVVAAAQAKRVEQFEQFMAKMRELSWVEGPDEPDVPMSA